MSLLTKVIKSAVVCFAVGFALAFTVPPIAAALSIPAASVALAANPMWSGAFFSAWGAINAVAEPIIGRFFATAVGASQAEHQYTQNLARSYSRSMQMDMKPEELQNERNYRHKIAQERVETLLNPKHPGL